MADFKRYKFKKKITVNLVEDLKNNNIDMKNSSEYLKYVVDRINDDNSNGYGYNKITIQDVTYNITPTFETDGTDIFIIFDIYESYSSHEALSDPNEVDKWLREQEKLAKFPKFYEEYAEGVVGLVNNSFFYPLCTGWSFEGTKFIDVSGNEVSTRIPENMHSKPIMINTHFYYDGLIP